MPLLTTKPWFGPKRIGWGLRPVAWQGWAVTAMFFGSLIYMSRLGFYNMNHKYIVLGIVVVYLIIAQLTGTKPGSDIHGTTHS